MMKEVPNFDKRIVPVKDRDCELCRHWNGEKCTLSDCPYFD